MRLRLDLEEDATERLIAAAVRNRRPVHLQAEALLREALGLPVSPAPEPPKREPKGAR